MSLGAILWLVAVALIAAAALLGARWFKRRGQRLITCPENRRPAGVALDALSFRAGLRLRSCSRWPERQGCGQECLQQIEAAPDGCLVRHILAEWYRSKSCAVCAKPFGEIHWTEHKPALRDAAGRTVEWGEIATEAVPEVLATHAPVCWHCHIVGTFCREHPELVVDRHR